VSSDWQDIYLRDEGGGTDIIFDGGVSGWPVHVTDKDLRLLLARLLERAGARYEVRDDRHPARDTDPDGQYARSRNAGGSSAYRVVAIVLLDA
jgi:hypothetical protein